MPITVIRTPQEVLTQVLQDYESKGYRVLLQPRGADLPNFLRAFRPDAIVSRGNENIVVEVSAASGTATGESFMALSEELARHPGWKLEIIWAGKTPGIDVTKLKSPSIEDIRKELPKVRDLYSDGEGAAALLLLWSLLEAALRRRLSEVEPDPYGPQTPNALVKTLVSYGYLDQKEYDRMVQIASVRDAIAHGHSTLRVDRKTFDRLFALVEKMTREPATAGAAD